MLFETLLGHTLIAADDTWGLLGVMCISVSVHLAGAEVQLGVQGIRRYHRSDPGHGHGKHRYHPHPQRPV